MLGPSVGEVAAVINILLLVYDLRSAIRQTNVSEWYFDEIFIEYYKLSGIDHSVKYLCTYMKLFTKLQCN